MNFKTPIGILRILAILEGVSYLGLFITMPLKYVLDQGMPNKIVGMAHGVFFIAYIFMVYYVNTEKKWDNKTNFWAYIASLIPFGTFVADAKIFKPAQEKVS
jgi:integral membrane protein